MSERRKTTPEVQEDLEKFRKYLPAYNDEQL